MAKRNLLLAITLLAPLLLFGAVELLLRGAGIGNLEPLFVDVPDAPGYLQPNPAVVQRFFPDPRDAPDVSIDTTWFPAAKAPGTLRIFVQGESTAAGFPYGRWASPAALLQQRLQRAYPDRNVEVISTALAVATSYVLLDLADEIIAQQPDAVVIYTGHNEFLGIGGVGSSLASYRSPMLGRTITNLRRLHLYRGLERGLTWFRPAALPMDRRDSALMSRVAAERSIPYGSPLYEQGLARFRDNLGRLLRKYRDAGVPAFVGTLASNTRDQPPFASGEAPESSASARYQQARTFEEGGDFAAARQAYLAAKDRDELRIRAPEDFNEIIREAAAKADAEVVDVQAAFGGACKNGIIGDELMLDHIHPNVEGYFRLSSAYYGAILTLAGKPAVEVDDAMARREIPVTEIDRLHGEYRMAELKNDRPFAPERQPLTLPTPADRVQQIAQQWFMGQLDWTGAMTAALAWYEGHGNATEAARVAVNLADALVNSAEPQFTAGRALLHAEQPARGQHYLQRAVAIDRENLDYRLLLAQAQFVQGHPQDSIATLEAILAQHPGEERATYWLAEVRRRQAASP